MKAANKQNVRTTREAVEMPAELQWSELHVNMHAR